jgi:dTDP-4-dehydrorhamnose reductase
MIMHFLVVGRGWTGKKVFDNLVERGFVVTMASHNSAISALHKNRYDWVVNCAGVTGTPNVDACELDKQNTVYGNAIYPGLLYAAAEENGVRMSHFSSGCIYTGDIQTVDAPPNFFGSTYSVAKGVSDVYLGDKAQVYRIRMPFTGKVEPKNYLYKVYNYAKNAKLIDAGQNSLTDLDEAVNVACDLMLDEAPDGHYNLVNRGSVNMHELADIMGIQPQWFTPDEFRAATAAGRSTCTIPAYDAMSDVRDALENAVSRMKPNLY